MRKVFFIINLFVLTLIFGGCSDGNKSTPTNFAFEFRYGVEAKNILNTFESKFTKDMVIGEPLTIDFKLTNGQLNSIYQKMMEINFFDYPRNFKPKDGLIFHTFVTPHNTYIFKVRAGSTIKVITWEDSNMSKRKDAQNLRELTTLIMDMVHKSAEFKKLPPPRGGYD